MKQKEQQMQREQNVIKFSLFFLLFIISTSIFSQKFIEGKYIIKDGIGDFATICIFNKNGIFKEEAFGHLGVESYGKGHYYIKKDSLILNYDLTDLKTNDYHKYKYFANQKDSIKIRVSIRDMNNKPLSNISILNFKNKIDYKSNSNGIIQFSLRKEKKKIELHIVNDALGYDFFIWTDKNYEIEVFLRQGNYAIPYKNQISKYKILKLTKEELKLRTQDNKTVTLKKIKN